ncbi:MAG TPA: NAD-dependent succinate-semialdehyde dehydrogenase [Stellaceae bacterium]
MIEAINPTTGQRIARYDEMSADAVAHAIERAHEQFLAWRTTAFAHRAGLMHKAAAILRANAKDYGRLMAEEMGKPIKDGIGEANKSALGCDYYADHAEQFLAPETVATDARKSFIAFQPIGIVLAVMPWNFPFWQVFRFAAPGLMAGNACVLKHASNVPGCALAIEKIFAEAGFPEGLFRTLMIGSKGVDAVIEHPLVRAVTLTGSTAAGRAVAAKAGHMLKKTVLELGGSDAYVVLDDADIDQAARICTKGRLVNSGQSCIAAKRFIVTGKTRAAFEAAFVKEMSAVTMGDPLDEANAPGPQARHDLRDDLHRQVQDSIAKGAKCLLGGAIPNNKGAFYPPTILTNVTPGMPAYDEEMFGPVASIIPVADEDRAFAVANDSVFGLGGAIIGRDLARAERLAVERMEAGTVFVNEAVRSDPRLPFGGIKESGYGRELSIYGIREFVNIKTIFIA